MATVEIFTSEPDTTYPISDPTRRKLAVSMEDPTAANEILDALDNARSNTGQMIIDLSAFKIGVTFPAPETIGTTPTVNVLLFTATNELVSGTTLFPDALDRTRPVQFKLEFALSAGQTNGDVLDITADYIAAGHGPGNGYAKTSTNLTSSVTCTTAQGLGIGDVYHVDFILQPLDANNPLADAESISFEFHMTNVDEVTEIYFVGGAITFFDAHPGPPEGIMPI
jgi:hypothetical protein